MTIVRLNKFVNENGIIKINCNNITKFSKLVIIQQEELLIFNILNYTCVILIVFTIPFSEIGIDNTLTIMSSSCK